MTRVIKGPDGKFKTVDDGPKIDLERIRRETRDVIQGNVPFHTDPFTPRKQADIDRPLQECFCAFIGGECDACKNLEN